MVMQKKDDDDSDPFRLLGGAKEIYPSSNWMGKNETEIPI